VRWLANSPSVTNVAYCESCMAEREEEWLCHECPANEWLSILPENEQAVRLFRHCWFSWRIRPDGLPFALNMQDVDIKARAMGVELDEPLLDQLEVMESTFIEALSEKREAERNSNQ